MEAWDRAKTTKIGTGTLVTIDNQIDPTTGIAAPACRFRQQRQPLFPNQFVNVRLLVEQKHGVTLVPSAAIQRNHQFHLRLPGEAGLEP